MQGRIFVKTENFHISMKNMVFYPMRALLSALGLEDFMEGIQQREDECGRLK
jgi:hypothetical protein